MTGPLAERIRALAERLDPNPPTIARRPTMGEYIDAAVALTPWKERARERGRMLYLATPGALLGAAVDLLAHKVGSERAAQMLARAAKGERDTQDILAALVAAMEEV